MSSSPNAGSGSIRAQALILYPPRGSRLAERMTSAQSRRAAGAARPCRDRLQSESTGVWGGGGAGFLIRAVIGPGSRRPLCQRCGRGASRTGTVEFSGLRIARGRSTKPPGILCRATDCRAAGGGGGGGGGRGGMEEEMVRSPARARWGAWARAARPVGRKS